MILLSLQAKDMLKMLMYMHIYTIMYSTYRLVILHNFLSTLNDSNDMEQMASLFLTS